MKTRDMVTTALMAALLCVLAPNVIPLAPIPLSLATFAVYLAAAVLGAKRGTAVVALYLLIGLIGVPVFSGYTGGFQKLFGPTGGYLIGYLLCAWITGLGVKPGETASMRKWPLPVMMALGTIALYALGTVWFLIQSGNALWPSLTMCVLPFLPGDAAKIAAASLLAWPLRKALYSSR